MLNEKNEKELEQINAEREAIVEQYEVSSRDSDHFKTVSLEIIFALRIYISYTYIHYTYILYNYNYHNVMSYLSMKQHFGLNSLALEKEARVKEFVRTERRRACPGYERSPRPGRISTHQTRTGIF